MESISTESRSTGHWPEDIFDFAYVPAMDERLAELAVLAEPEDWSYQHTSGEHPHTILYNYVRYTYLRLAEESKLEVSENGQFCCFNTALVTPNQEAIYASFEVNRVPDAQPWFFKGWFRRGQWELNVFGELPELAHYFDDPSHLVFDSRRDFRVNVEHIISETPREVS